MQAIHNSVRFGKSPTLACYPAKIETDIRCTFSKVQVGLSTDLPQGVKQRGIDVTLRSPKQMSAVRTLLPLA